MIDLVLDQGRHNYKKESEKEHFSVGRDDQVESLMIHELTEAHAW